MNLPITVQQSLKITFIEWVFQAECMMIAMPDTTPAHSQTVIRLCAGKEGEKCTTVYVAFSNRL